MTTMKVVRARSVGLMQKTRQSLSHLLADVDETTAVTLRDPNDGDKGWTTLEIVCHLRDFDEIFYQRAVRMRDETDPQLAAHDHEQMAVDRAYNTQVLSEVWRDLDAKRGRFVRFWQDLDEAQWQKTGQHPERDSFDMTDAVMQVGWHDVNHIEQITRILAQARRV